MTRSLLRSSILHRRPFWEDSFVRLSTTLLLQFPYFYFSNEILYEVIVRKKGDSSVGGRCVGSKEPFPYVIIEWNKTWNPTARFKWSVPSFIDFLLPSRSHWRQRESRLNDRAVRADVSNLGKFASIRSTDHQNLVIDLSFPFRSFPLRFFPEGKNPYTPSTALEI